MFVVSSAVYRSQSSDTPITVLSSIERQDEKYQSITNVRELAFVRC